MAHIDNLHGLTEEEIQGVKNEQLATINEWFVPYADKDCKECFGRAYSAWDHNNLRYIICSCVLTKVEQIKAEQNQEDIGKPGIIDKCRTVFKMN